jgi:hypothetical protein
MVHRVGLRQIAFDEIHRVKRKWQGLFFDFPSVCSLCFNVSKSRHGIANLTVMYHLLKGLHAHFTRKDEYSVLIIGLDNVSSLRTVPARISLISRSQAGKTVC